MSEIRLNSLLSTQLQKIQTKQNDTLIGIPVEFEFSENGLSNDVIVFHGFYCVNPKEAKDATELYLDLSLDPKFETNEFLKNAAKDLFKDKLSSLKVEIQKNNPDFFNQINKICFEAKNNGADKNIKEAILDSLIKGESKPLAIGGLPGYGKTTIINEIFKDTSDLSISIEDFSKKYNISLEDAKKLKTFRNNMRMMSINPTMSINDLYGHLTLISHPKTKQQIMDYANSPLMEVVKGVYYAGQKGIFCFDELFDNPELMIQLKAVIMASNGIYNFAPNYSRDFMEIKSPFKVKMLNGTLVDFNYAIFEVAKNSDKRFAVDDNCIELNGDGTFFVINSNLLNAHQKSSFNNSIVSEALNQKINNPNNENFSKIMTDITNHKFAQLNTGLKIFLISQQKAEEIQNSKILYKTSSEAKPFIIPATDLKILATGNALSNVPPAALDRFTQLWVDGISYDELLNNFTSGIGVGNKFIDKLKEKNPDNSAVVKYIDIVLNFVKHIARSQHDGELNSPQTDMGKEPVFREGVLSSTSLNPRMIASIINNSYSIEELIKNFKNNANQILGIEGYPDENEENDIVRFNDKVDEVLTKNLMSFCKKYKISNKIETSNPAYNRLLEDIPAVSNAFGITTVNSFEQNEEVTNTNKIKI